MKNYDHVIKNITLQKRDRLYILSNIIIVTEDLHDFYIEINRSIYYG